MHNPLSLWGESLPPFWRSILAKAVRQSLLLTAFTVLVLTVCAFLIARGMLEQRVLAQLSSVATASEDTIEEALRASREQHVLLTTHSTIEKVLVGGESQAVFEEFFVALRRDYPEILGLRMYTESHELLVSVGAPVTPPRASRATTLIPLHGRRGWESYDISTPIRSPSGILRGFLSSRFAVSPISRILLRPLSSLGETASLTLGVEEEGSLLVLYQGGRPDTSYTISVGDVSNTSVKSLPIARGTVGEEGYMGATSEQGKEVLAAYRFLPSLGFGLAVQVEKVEALRAVTVLASFLTAVGVLLLLLSGSIAFLLAQQLADPLHALAIKLSHLRPGAWGLRRSVHTGDEVELLDCAVVDMAKRLQAIYDHLEEEVAARTEELKKQYLLDHTILESIQQGVVTVDHTGMIMEVNSAALSLLGLPKEKLLGVSAVSALKFCEGQDVVPPKKHPVVFCLQKRKSFRSVLGTRLNLLKDDREFLPIVLSAAPLIQHHRLHGVVVVFHDVTEERKLDYMKSEFISLASHQLRTPLSAFRWYLELLSGRGGKLSHEQREYVREMRHAADRMTNLLSALLHAAKLEGGTITADVRRVNLTDLVRELAEDWKHLASDAKLTSSLSLPSSAVWVMTDPVLLRIVLQNLMINAVKYSRPGGRVHLTLQCGKSSVRIAVHDTGVGVPVREQKNVFQKFFRASNIRSMDTDGSGLGLYISKSVVERLGGKLTFQSTEGKGSTFTVRLPRRVGKGRKRG